MAGFPKSPSPVHSGAKFVAWRSGAIGIYQRMRRGDCLTVLMFHRVVPQVERLWPDVDPLYTVTPELLSDVVDFVRNRYAIVGLDDVLRSLRRQSPLPKCPLLLTFDDGWRDNLEWAAPVLRGVPWTVFVATDATSEPNLWWQELLLWTLRTGRASFEELWNAGDCAGAETRPAGRDVLHLLQTYGQLPAERRRELLDRFARELMFHSPAPHMLSFEDLRTLRDGGVSIASHGASHLPLSRCPDARSDLRRSAEYLEPFAPLPALSFPHGGYTDETVETARSLGYEAMFTSDAVLNSCPDGWLQSGLIGRIPLNSRNITTANGTLSPARLYSRLVVRDVTALSHGAGRRGHLRTDPVTQTR